LYAEGKTLGDYYKYVQINANTRIITIIDLERCKSTWYNANNIADKLYGLIKADLVEKVEEE